MSRRNLGLGLLGIAALFAGWKAFVSAGPGARAGGRNAVRPAEPSAEAASLEPENGAARDPADLEIPESEPLRAEPKPTEPEPAEEALVEAEVPLEVEVPLEQSPGLSIPELVLPEELGWVRGRLLAENGSFEENVLDLAGAIVLELESFEPPAQSLRADLELVEEPGGERVITFAFEGVALDAEYELTLSTLGNHRWEPMKQVVRAPIEGVEFMRYDLDAQGPVEFRILDSETGEPIEGYRLRTVRATHSEENGIFLHTGPLDPDQVAMQGAVDWTVDAPGYAPAFGDEASFYFEGEQRICEVRLGPGWATRFLVLGTRPRASDGEPVTVALAGAEVSLDGVVAGLTAEDGTLVCRLPETPAEVEVRHESLIIRSTVDGLVEGRTAGQRGNVSVVLMRASESEETPR